jgi:hypothetical protein
MGLPAENIKPFKAVERPTWEARVSRVGHVDSNSKHKPKEVAGVSPIAKLIPVDQALVLEGLK